VKPAAPKRQRCAVYTRKSTEHNLDLVFNSLDAQREACEAYVKSQAHEGWTLVRDRFDDGGLSGASLDRPALQDLLNRVRARQIDVIVVYKVDRLTRSLADFAKLVELFDEHGVSFVSITQSFNTTSSMGRLTLNVLLSFAQFEREVIGERVRDKIAASKRKGLWVGGPAPLGYRSQNKKLDVVPEEAELVRKIFADYLRLGSIGALAASLRTEGLKPRPRPLANGRTIQAPCYRVGPLAHLLKNRFYVGEIAYRGEIHSGEHEPILDRGLFEAVQQKLKDQAVERSHIRSSSCSILAGRIFDDRGNPMTPTHANKRGVRYRYYVSQALLQGRKTDAGAAPRVSAPDVETVIAAAIRADVGAPEAASDWDSIEAHLAKAVVAKDHIAITLRRMNRGGTIDPGSNTDKENERQMDGGGEGAHHTDGDEGIKCRNDNGGTSDPRDAINDGCDAAWSPPAIIIPFRPTPRLRKGVAHAPPDGATLDEAARGALLTAIARSKSWIETILKDPSLDFAAIAEREKLSGRYIRLLAPLAFLSPRVVEAIAAGGVRPDLTVSSLVNNLPLAWSEQGRRLGLG
jgi:site-specific DNA recombinase